MEKDKKNLLLALSFLFFALFLNSGYYLFIKEFETDNTYSQKELSNFFNRYNNCKINDKYTLARLETKNDSYFYILKMNYENNNYYIELDKTHVANASNLWKGISHDGEFKVKATDILLNKEGFDFKIKKIIDHKWRKTIDSDIYKFCYYDKKINFN